MKKIVFILAIAILALNTSAQLQSSQRIPLIGTKAPSFKAPSTNGITSFPEDYPTQWKILFAHPRDFTPVCSSEILELAYNQSTFKELNTQIVVISVDKLVSHQSWKSDLEKIAYKNRGKINIDFPIVVDSSYAISYKYGMIDPNAKKAHSVRGVFFIDPENKIRAFQFYPNEVGRNTNEIIRTLKALQTHDSKENIVLPANWQPGDDYMIPSLSAKDKKELKESNTNISYINWYMIYRKDTTINLK